MIEKRCEEDTHDVLWTSHGAALIGQCTRCRVNVNVVTGRATTAAGLDTTCSTDNRPSRDFDGCTD